MSSWLPSRSPSGFQTASTRMPIRVSSAFTSWMSAKIEMSAPSRATDDATYGSSRFRPITGMFTMQNVVTTPRSATGTSSSQAAMVAGLLTIGGTKTLPVSGHFDPRMVLSLSARR